MGRGLVHCGIQRVKCRCCVTMILLLLCGSEYGKSVLVDASTAILGLPIKGDVLSSGFRHAQPTRDG